MNSPRPLAGLLHDKNNSTLDGLLQRCQQLLRLEQQLSACLDIESAAHCRVINVQQGELLLGVDTAAWASRMRYQLPTLLDCARRQRGLGGLQSIRLSIMPPEGHLRPPPKHTPITLSRDSAHALLGCASGIEHDKLRQALERLASRATKKKEV